MTSLRRALSVAAALLAVVLVAAGPSIVVSGQLLAYQEGFVFFTTGDGFRVAPASSFATPRPAAARRSLSPAPRMWARAPSTRAGR